METRPEPLTKVNELVAIQQTVAVQIEEVKLLVGTAHELVDVGVKDGIGWDCNPFACWHLLLDWRLDLEVWFLGESTPVLLDCSACLAEPALKLLE